MTAQQDAAGGSTPSEVSAPPEPSAAATSAAEEGASLGVRPAVEPAKKRPRLGEDPSGPSTATSAEDAESAAAVAAGPTAEEEAMAAAASLMMHSCGQSEPPTSRSGSGGAAAAGSPAPRLDPAMEAAINAAREMSEREEAGAAAGYRPASAAPDGTKRSPSACPIWTTKGGSSDPAQPTAPIATADSPAHGRPAEGTSAAAPPPLAAPPRPGFVAHYPPQTYLDSSPGPYAVAPLAMIGAAPLVYPQPPPGPDGTIAPYAAGGPPLSAVDKDTTRTVWTQSEDSVIMQAVASIGGKWRRIAEMLPNRSDDAVRNRWHRLEEARKYHQQKEVASTQGLAPAVVAPSSGVRKAGYKCSKCGMPKKHHICQAQAAQPMPPDPMRAIARRPPPAKPHPPADSESGDISRLGWSKEEDNLILSSVAELGPKWMEIAARLPTRTDHAARNRYHRLLRLHEQSRTPYGLVGDDGGYGALPAPPPPVAYWPPEYQMVYAPQMGHPPMPGQLMVMHAPPPGYPAAHPAAPPPPPGDGGVVMPREGDAGSAPPPTYYVHEYAAAAAAAQQQQQQPPQPQLQPQPQPHTYIAAGGGYYAMAAAPSFQGYFPPPQPQPQQQPPPPQPQPVPPA